MNSIWESVQGYKKFISPGRTIGEGDISLLSSLTWITVRLHTDREYMRHHQFGERVLPGPCLLACVVGLAAASGLLETLERDGLTVMAMLGFERVRFTAPVKPGDTITVHSEILEARPTGKNPRRGVLRVEDVAFNQDGQEVMNAIRSIMLELIT